MVVPSLHPFCSERFPRSTVLSKNWGTCTPSCGVHFSLHAAQNIPWLSDFNTQTCIFDHLHPSHPPLNQAPTNLFSESMRSVISFPMLYVHVSICNCLSVSEFFRREPHQSSDRTLSWIPCEARMMPGLGGGPQVRPQDPCLPLQPFQNGPLTPNLGLGVRHRRMRVPIGWMCPEFPRWGRGLMAWVGVSVKQWVCAHEPVNAGDRGNQVQK